MMVDTDAKMLIADSVMEESYNCQNITKEKMLNDTGHKMSINI